MIVDVLMSLAPREWASMRVSYRFDHALAIGITEPFVMKAGGTWERVSYSGFELMDFFDALREADAQVRWTTVTVTISRGSRDPEIEYGFGPPNVLSS